MTVEHSEPSLSFVGARPTPHQEAVHTDTPVTPTQVDTPPRSRGWEATLFLAMVSFGFIGQYFLSNVKQSMRDGLMFYGISIALFLLLVTRLDLSVTRTAEAGASAFSRLLALIRRERSQILLLFASVLIAYAAIRLLQTKTGTPSYWDVAGLWLLSIIMMSLVFVRPRFTNPLALLQTMRLDLITVAGLTLLAAAPRLILLGGIPEIISGDEGRIGILTLNAAQGQMNPFITTYGHSTLYIYLRAIPYLLFGMDPLNFANLRMIEAITGALTIPATYFLGARMFDRRVGLIAAILLAVSHFHIHFSRINVNGGLMDAFFTTVAVYFFYGGFKYNRRSDFVLSALTVGLHLYIYMGGRLTLLFLLATVVALIIVNPKLLWANLVNLGVFVFVYAIVAVPMGYWAYKAPNEFLARVNTMSIFQSGWLEGETKRANQPAWQVLWGQLWTSILAFIYYPAKGFYNSRLPMLDAFTAMPAVLGVVYGIIRTFDVRFLLLNAWLWSAVVSGQAILQGPDGSIYRIIMVAPVVMIFAAIAWVKFLDLASRAISSDRRLLIGITAVFLGLVAYTNLQYYFGEFAQKCVYEEAGTRYASIVGVYVGNLPRNSKVYLYGEPRVVYGIHPSFEFLAKKIPVQNINAQQGANPNFVDPDLNAIFIFSPERMPLATVVEKQFPGGRWLELTDCGATVVKVYEVSRS